MSGERRLGLPVQRAAFRPAPPDDSFVLAELARTDSHRFRVLVPDSDRTKGGYRGSLTKTWFRPPRRLIARCDDAPASRGHRAAARLPGTQIMWPSWRRRSQLHRASRPEMT